MALPYDALTAALDAWLGQHIPSLTMLLTEHQEPVGRRSFQR
jgi:hypothetical protein